METVKQILWICAALVCVGTSNTQEILYTMPGGHLPHEGTWLSWPHNFTYPPYYQEDLEPMYISITEALITSEKVHIIAYNTAEHNHILNVLEDENIPLDSIDFHIIPTNDCWIRDNGPTFVFDSNNALHAIDFGFNGWGGDYEYDLDDVVPIDICGQATIPIVDLNELVLEGGAIEVDGNGSMLATKSSIINPDRNPNLTQEQIENYLTEYLGIENFIWLEGVAGLEVTDMHIDGFAMFAGENTIVTMDSLSLIYWDVPADDISTLYNAQNIAGENYDFVFLPLTQNNVVTSWGENLGYKGSYVNFNIANEVVLVPAYNDPMDDEAISILQELFPYKECIGIDCRNLYYGGGMVHCITQQQPRVQSITGLTNTNSTGVDAFEFFPNPCSEVMKIHLNLSRPADCELQIFNSPGVLIETVSLKNLGSGNHFLSLKTGQWNPGIYHLYWLCGDLPMACRTFVKY